MQGNLEKRGQYELFETSKGHQILNLNNKEFYAVVEGQRGDILVHSDSEHKKKKTVKKGRFFLADFSDDPEFRDMPHLFLEESKQQYREWILPRGMPTGGDHQKKLVRTRSKASGKKVQAHTGAKSRSGGQARKSAGRDDLATMSKAELYNMAKRKDLEGRSKMDKDELIRALKKAK